MRSGADACRGRCRGGRDGSGARPSPGGDHPKSACPRRGGRLRRRHGGPELWQRRVHAVSLPLEEYPALPEQPAPAGTVDGGVLAVAAAQVVPAASRDDTLPMLTAVCLEIDGETLTLAATDRYRLAVREVSWVPAVPGLRAA